MQATNDSICQSLALQAVTAGTAYPWSKYAFFAGAKNWSIPWKRLPLNARPKVPMRFNFDAVSKLSRRAFYYFYKTVLQSLLLFFRTILDSFLHFSGLSCGDSHFFTELSCRASGCSLQN